MRPDYGNAVDTVGRLLARLLARRPHAHVAEAGRLDAHLVAAAEVDHDAAGAALGQERLRLGGYGLEQGGQRGFELRACRHTASVRLRGGNQGILFLSFHTLWTTQADIFIGY